MHRPPPAGYLTDEERARFARRFSRTLHLAYFAFYWLPARRSLIARSVLARRHFRMPEGTVLVGTYAAPFKAADFVSDLEDLVASLHVRGRAEAVTEDLQEPASA